MNFKLLDHLSDFESSRIASGGKARPKLRSFTGTIGLVLLYAYRHRAVIRMADVFSPYIQGKISPSILIHKTVMKLG